LEFQNKVLSLSIVQRGEPKKSESIKWQKSNASLNRGGLVRKNPFQWSSRISPLCSFDHTKCENVWRNV